MFDYLIKGGTIVDGTGAESFQADIGISGDRIVAIGKLDGDAAEVIDATGLVVSPGFVDPHTHYDAQLFWDPRGTPSNLHGVTSAVMGNCGFTLAPVNNEQDADYLRKMMVKVEGMPLEALETGVSWDWNGYGEYLSRLEGKIGLNVATMVGHCALRLAVMGPDGASNIIFRKEIEESTNPEETRKEKIENYKELFAKPYTAAKQGFVDTIIEPRYTRRELLRIRTGL